jgi:hypothetical protein
MKKIQTYIIAVDDLTKTFAMVPIKDSPFKRNFRYFCYKKNMKIQSV